MGLLILRASDGRVGDGEPRADEHQRGLGVVRLGNRREGELGDRARTKDEAVSRSMTVAPPRMAGTITWR
jgi:hypothetical protein